MGAALLATGGMGVAMAEGGVSAHIALSNTIFNMKVSGLQGDGFSLFPDVDKTHSGEEAISRIRMDKAKIGDVCMTAPIKLPGVGDKKFQMLVPNNGFSADNLVLGATGLEGQLTLDHPQVGIDAHEVNKDAKPGMWGLMAGSMTSDSQGMQATSLTADKLTSAGSKVSIEDPNDAKC